ncbi:MAG: type II toxin-antitoxin system PemK/MazF family toxin [Micrococcales bacterium]|nr:type II toxin-antitoxin system PemK/MazF family toxin [Micrococcales bacterium]
MAGSWRQQLARIVGRGAVEGARSFLRARQGAPTASGDTQRGEGPGAATAPPGSRRTHGRNERTRVRATPGRGARRDSASGQPRTPTEQATSAAYPGDFEGVPEMTYSPNPDGRPDPGEVVWTWVPYEEEHKKGKDRPVLIIGRDEGGWLLALQLTSKDHQRDAQQEREAGRLWLDVGHGGWDRHGRDSEIRVNRIIRVRPEAMRREGAVMDRATFDEVADAVRASMA